MNRSELHELEASLQREQRYAANMAYLYHFALDLMAQGGGAPDSIYDKLPEMMRTLFACERSAVFVTDEATGGLTLVAAGGGEWPELSTFSELLLTGERAMVYNGSLGSMLGIPLLNNDDIFGALMAFNGPTLTPFGDNEIQLITLLAGVTGTMLVNAALRQRLDERLNLLQMVMESSPSGLAIIERDRLLTANPSALHMLALDHGAFDRPLTHSSQDGPLLELLHEALPPSHSSTFEYHIDNGQRQRILQIDVVPVGSDKLLAQINDITMLRDVESRREEAVASTSHELKTPLAVMNLGLSNLLSYYEQMPDQDRRVMIEETLDQVGEMKTLISSLLDHSRQSKYTTQRIKTLPELRHPAAVISQIVKELSVFARHQNIQLVWHEPPHVGGLLLCSESDLKTIIRNLISNAIKYTPEGGTVTIDVAACVDQRYTVVVSDTGVGIPAAELRAIFERSYRASTRGDVEGSGLGLNMAHNLVGRVGGTIEVESEVGVGSTFIVSLPCID